MSLTRDQILAADDVRKVEVKIPQWGDSIFVRTLSGAQRDELESAIVKARQDGSQSTSARARFCVAFACDADGSPLFTMADVPALAAKSGAALSLILDAGLDLNAMREKDVEELEKN